MLSQNRRLIHANSNLLQSCRLPVQHLWVVTLRLPPHRRVEFHSLFSDDAAICSQTMPTRPRGRGELQWYIHGICRRRTVLAGDVTSVSLCIDSRQGRDENHRLVSQPRGSVHRMPNGEGAPVPPQIQVVVTRDADAYELGR